MKNVIYVLNGPNLNLLGTREPEIYGKENYSALVGMIKDSAKKNGVRVKICQSNHEGVLVDKIHEAYRRGAMGIIINPAAYTHTSIALLDAVKSVSIPCVEVHISNPSEREEFRKESFIGRAAANRICGHGLNGYVEALEWIVSNK